jgi:hypothetical protein
MKMPGFGAECSLYKTSEQYRISTVQNTLGRHTMVFPQWRPRCDLEACLSNCYLVDKQCVDGCYLLDAICMATRMTLPPW